MLGKPSESALAKAVAVLAQIHSPGPRPMAIDIIALALDAHGAEQRKAGAVWALQEYDANPRWEDSTADEFADAIEAGKVVVP
jgi:hypothetical protein